jgi:phage terminase small subunit
MALGGGKWAEMSGLQKNDADGLTLTRRQELFLGELCKARSIADAAKAARTSETTARRWLALPHVQTAYRDMRRQLVDDALAGLQSAARAAVVALVRNLSASAPPSVQVRAAEAILTNATQAVEIAEVLSRLERIEQRVVEQQQASPFHRGGGIPGAGRVRPLHG